MLILRVKIITVFQNYGIRVESNDKYSLRTCKALYTLVIIYPANSLVLVSHSTVALEHVHSVSITMCVQN